MADKFTIKFDAQMEIGQLKTAINQIQQEFKKIQIPQNATKPLTNTLEQLSKEIDNFEKLTSKSVGSKADFGKIEKSSQHLLDLWEKLNKSYEDLTSLSDSKLKKLFPEEISNNIKKATTALKDYEKQTGEIDDNIKKIENSLKKAQEAQEKLTKDIEKENSKKIVDTEGFNNFKKEIQATEKELSEYKKKLEEINNFIAEKNATLPYPKKSNPYREAVKQAKELGETIVEVQEKLDNLYNDSTNITTKEQHVKELAKINEKYQETSAEVQEFSKQLKEAEKSGIDNSNKAFNTLAETLKELLGLDISTLGTDSKEVGKAIEQYITNKVNQMRQSVDNAKSPIQNFGQVVQDTANKTHALGEEVRDFDQRAKEIDAIKSRITAFFGLNNAIMLARRALRSAYDTVKELDKAMTETAVVTNFSVGDMWSQLPEYTKRANELGVTTLEAYQASTLFYQQGLKTNEVVALSNETLKMARIAGLDAAEATDRMTNALRGFNMTLTETNAQRIDDVYSKLAAITASNVDEISTAMTKVASLAHNANMEFETTSAFLAQIIETTRESAETAGTALKTVVARFSEVKDLYTKEELTGTDEEGEVIDVNKISKALRTAGIDLNRYFLGTVGLDDIFMELAEKWDSLTNVQQRYIATQAAGSRQQSRFIALMSDYARTQELVSAAYNANGAAAEQFEKTQESLQSKLARLKNAWDEFTMGLANSTLIKTGVELLTGVLTVVNKLTTGFGLLEGKVGSFVSALLKIGTVMGARSLAKGPAAMLINSLGSIIGFEGVSNKEAYLRSVFRNDSDAIGNLKDTSWRDIFKQQFTGIFSNIKDRRANRAENLDIMFGEGKPGESLDVGLFGNLGLKMSQTGFSQAFAKTKLGSGMASGLGKLLGFGAGEGGVAAASGVAALSVALIGVAAAGTAAYGVIKMLYDASPQGQIKYAEQVKSEIDHTKSSLEATKKTLDETLDSYNQQLDSLSKLEEGTIEWANAFLEVNKTVSDLIERFPKLAAYVTTTSNGLLQLDKKGLAQYQKELNEQIGKYSALSIMATGGVAQRKAMASKEATEAAGQQYLAEASFAAAARSLTKGEYTDEVYKAFAQNFDFNDWAKKAGESAGSGTGNFLGIGIGANTLKTKSKLRQEYKELTGQEADTNWNANQLKDAIGQFNNTEKIEEYLNNINTLVEGIAKAQDEGQEGANDFQDIITGIANEEATNMANSIMGQYSQILSEKDLERIASSTYSFGTYDINTISEVQSNFEQIAKWAQERSGLDEQAFNAAIQKFYNVNTLAEAGYALYKDILNNSEQFNITRQETNKAVNEKLGYVGAKKFDDFMSNSKLMGSISNETYSKLGEVFVDLSLKGVNVSETFKNLTPEAAELLAQLDASDPDVIRMVIGQLETMGVDIDQEVIDSLITLASASTAAADALEGIGKAGDMFQKASELKDRESFIFSAEEYEQYKNYDQDGFVKLGEDSYVYLRDSLDPIINGLNEAAKETVENELQELQKHIAKGEVYKTRFDERYAQYAIAQSTLPANKQLTPEEITKKVIDDIAQELPEIAGDFVNYINLEENRNAVTTGRELLSYWSTPNEKLFTTRDIQARFNANKNEELLRYQKKISDELQKQEQLYVKLDGKTVDITKNEEARETYAKKLALLYSEQVDSYNNMFSIINENKDNLLIEDKSNQFYKDAVQDVAQAIEEMYGFSHETAVKFVEEHDEAIAKAIETEDNFKNFLLLTAEAWRIENSNMIESVADAMGTSTIEVNNKLDEIANRIRALPDGEIGFDIKTEEALKALATAGFDIENFLKSMGFELVASPGDVTQIPNPYYESMANMAAPPGLGYANMAEAAGIPKTTTVTNTRFVWRRIGAGDVNVPPPTTTPSPKTEEPPTKKQLLEQQYSDLESQYKTAEARGESKEFLSGILDKLKDTAEQILIETRRELGIEGSDEELKSLEELKGDTEDSRAYVRNIIDLQNQQVELLKEEINEEPVSLDQQLSRAGDIWGRVMGRPEDYSLDEMALAKDTYLRTIDAKIAELEREKSNPELTEAEKYEIDNEILKLSNEREDIGRDWAEYIDSLPTELEKSIEHGSESISKQLQQIELLESNRDTSTDELIDAYSELAKYYKEQAELYEKNGQTDEATEALIEWQNTQNKIADLQSKKEEEERQLILDEANYHRERADYLEKTGADREEIISELQQERAEWEKILLEAQENNDRDTILDTESKIYDIDKKIEELNTPPELESFDRYYNINNVLEELNETGKEINENLTELLKEPFDRQQLVEVVGGLLTNYVETIGALQYKGANLEQDRQNLINDEKYSELFARGLVSVLENGNLHLEWDAIDQLSDWDEETVNLLHSFLGEYGEIQNQIKDNESQLKSVNSNLKSLQDIEKQYRDTYINLEKKVIDSLIAEERESVEQQKEYYQKLNETNRDMLSAMQEQINLQRQIRDNTKEENEIRKLESRLAYLRRDTTGANAQEILELEKQIEEKRENYQDKLVDQQLKRLQTENQAREDFNNEKIKQLTERLDNLVETGAFNAEAAKIIEDSIDENGNLLTDSRLVQLLKKEAEWDSLTEEQQAKFMEDLEKSTNIASTYMYLKGEGEGGFFSDLVKNLYDEKNPILSFLTEGKYKNLSELVEAIINGSGNSDQAPLNGDVPNEGVPIKIEITETEEPPIGGVLGEMEERRRFNKEWNVRRTKYETGGLATKTGLAWLDGTLSRPEYVLNPSQTQAFLRLAEVLPSIMHGNTANSVDSVKNIYLNLTMNVDEIADDYDVDQIAERVKEIIYEAGTYRNVNILS